MRQRSFKKKVAKFAEVIVDISTSSVDRIFEYSVGDLDGVEIGMRVSVPFGNRLIEGYIIKLKETADYNMDKIKPIAKILDTMPVITSEMMALKDELVDNFKLRTVDVLRLFIPSQMRGGRIKELTKVVCYLNDEYKDKPIEEFIKPSALAQRDIFEYLLENTEAPQSYILQNLSASALKNLTMRDIVRQKTVAVARTPYKNLITTNNAVELTQEQNETLKTISANKSGKFLLHGVTGSGKTEVYMRVISDALTNDKTAIMLVPEIALTPQVLKNFRSKFGDKVALLHSGLSAGERFDEWQRLLTGEATVAVGARSAIFAPVKNLGVIIIDEEHDSSYISSTNPRYDAHFVAEFRQKFNNCTLILGSATPSIETYYKAVTANELTLLEMPTRVNKKPLPHIEIVNMCGEFMAGNRSVFSRNLELKLKECIDSGNQAMLFINRRGYSSYVICKSCGHVPKCEACDVSLVYHKEDNALKCHYCSARYAKLDLCPECKSESIRQGYVGTERVVEEIEEKFPHIKVLRMDNDTTRTKDAHANILEQFSKKQASVLVGTQMIAKGHDFASVTLVGIIDADLSLYFSDYKSIERTFSLITQVSGRAGREEKKGHVVLQTYSPNHYVYKYAVKNDYKEFFKKEVNLREVTKYPPFSLILRVLISSEAEEIASATAKAIFEDIVALSKAKANSFAYLGAMRAPVKKIQNKYRLQILARVVDNKKEIASKIYEIVEKHQNAKTICFVEQNPNNLS